MYAQNRDNLSLVVRLNEEPFTNRCASSSVRISGAVAMSSFVNFLKNIVSGLFSFLGGLVGSKKPQEAIAEAAPKPRKARNSGYFLELDDAKGVGSAATPAQASKQEPAKAEPAKAEPVKAEPAKAAVKSKQIKTPVTAEPKPAPKPAAANAALNLPQPTVTTFAPKYLASNGSSNGRRRPGANMSSFLDMARQIKPAN
jgi:hypothetical protein